MHQTNVQFCEFPDHRVNVLRPFCDARRLKSMIIVRISRQWAEVVRVINCKLRNRKTVNPARAGRCNCANIRRSCAHYLLLLRRQFPINHEYSRSRQTFGIVCSVPTHIRRKKNRYYSQFNRLHPIAATVTQLTRCKLHKNLWVVNTLTRKVSQHQQAMATLFVETQSNRIILATIWYLSIRINIQDRRLQIWP